METSTAFLNNIKIKIEQGAYDDHLALPFMSKDKLYDAIEKKVKERVKSGSTPILTDIEIEHMIKDMKETSGVTFNLFMKYGFLEEFVKPNSLEKGYQITEKGRMAIKQALRMN